MQKTHAPTRPPSRIFRTSGVEILDSSRRNLIKAPNIQYAGYMELELGAYWIEYRNPPNAERPFSAPVEIFLSSLLGSGPFDTASDPSFNELAVDRIHYLLANSFDYPPYLLRAPNHSPDEPDHALGPSLAFAFHSLNNALRIWGDAGGGSFGMGNGFGMEAGCRGLHRCIGMCRQSEYTAERCCRESCTDRSHCSCQFSHDGVSWMDVIGNGFSHRAGIAPQRLAATPKEAASSVNHPECRAQPIFTFFQKNLLMHLLSTFYSQSGKALPNTPLVGAQWNATPRSTAKALDFGGKEKTAPSLSRAAAGGRWSRPRVGLIHSNG